jgi:hypothetical protein
MALSAQEEAELAGLQQELGHAQPSRAPAPEQAPQQQGASMSSMSPQEEAELQRLQVEMGVEPGHATPWDHVKEAGAGALHYGLKGLGYLGGVARGTLAQNNDDKLEQMGIPEYKIGRPGDAQRIMTGNAPSTDEYLARAGVPEGPHADLLPEWAPFGQGDTTLRGFVGGVGDIATDPLTHLPLGEIANGLKGSADVGAGSAASRAMGTVAGKADDGLNILSNISKARGRSIYNSAFTKVDDSVLEKAPNAMRPSEVLWENRARGSAEDIKQQAKDLEAKYMAEKNALLQKGDDLGIMVDPRNADRAARDYAPRIARENRYLNDGVVTDLQDYINRGHTVSPEAAAKTDALNAAKLADYKDKFRTYLAANKDYKKVFGGSFDDGAQLGLTGFNDLKQVGGSRITPVELHGQAPAEMHAAPAQPLMNQDYLPDLAETANLGPVQGGGRAEGAARARAGQPSQYQKDFLDMGTKEQLSMFAQPGEIAGTELTPRSYAHPALPGSIDEAGQLSMVTAPPTRPARPVLSEAPIDKFKLSEAELQKTRLRDGLPASSYDAMGRPIAPAKKVEKLLADGYQHEVVREANAGLPGLGDEIAAKNKRIGSLIAAQKPIQKAVNRESTLRPISSTDGAGIGYAMARPAIGVPVMAGKKAFDLAKYTRFRTGLGLGLDALGDTRLMDPAFREMLIERDRQQNPWAEIVNSPAR